MDAPRADQVSSDAETFTLADVEGAPSWLPAARDLDELELVLLGVGDAGSVHVPTSVADRAAAGVGLVLTDPEGTPLALLTDVSASPAEAGGASTQLTGRVRALQPPEHGPFRRLRRSAADVRAELGGQDALAVPVDAPLRNADIDAIRRAARDRPILLLVTIGAGSPLVVDAGGVVRTTLAAADSLPPALVVPIPLVRVEDASAEESRRDVVARAYGATEVLHLSDVEAAATAVRARVDEGTPLSTDGPDGYPVGVLAELARSVRSRHERGVTVLFTGLSGSGKSTVARAFSDAVGERFGRTVSLLDGDVVRRMLSAGLTFSKEDRELNIRRIGFVAAEITRHGGMAVCCPIAPYAATRAEVRSMVEAVGAFVLIHISTPLAECERRDRKGLYALARAGKIPEFTGISDPYEAPTDADLAIDTTDVPVDEAVDRVVSLLEERGYLHG